jgi:hypothetical protein
MGHLLQHILHPHGWWIILDILLFGTGGTALLLAADDTDLWS